MPHEITLGEVYFPPLLVVAFFAYIITNVVATVLARAGIYKMIAAPAIFELSVFVLAAALLGLFFPFT